MTKKSVFGLNENTASLLCYLGFFFTGVIILVMEKENRTVRFHALQSTLWFMLLSIVSWVSGLVLGWIPILGGLLSSALGLITVASWAFLMYMAYMNKKFKIPMIGDTAESQINR